MKRILPLSNKTWLAILVLSVPFAAVLMLSLWHLTESQRAAQTELTEHIEVALLTSKLSNALQDALSGQELSRTTGSAEELDTAHQSFLIQLGLINRLAGEISKKSTNDEVKRQTRQLLFEATRYASALKAVAIIKNEIVREGHGDSQAATSERLKSLYGVYEALDSEQVSQLGGVLLLAENLEAARWRETSANVQKARQTASLLSEISNAAKTAISGTFAGLAFLCAIFIAWLWRRPKLPKVPLTSDGESEPHVRGRHERLHRIAHALSLLAAKGRLAVPASCGPPVLFPLTDRSIVVAGWAHPRRTILKRSSKRRIRFAH